MDIQAIGNRAFSVYIGEPELSRRHLEPRTMTVSAARALVRDIIGCDGPGPVSLELYPGRHEVLIFVKRPAGEPVFFSFRDLESVLEAIALLGREASSLFWLDGEYILVVWPEGGRAAALAEFGTAIEAPGGYLEYLREHGRALREGDAAAALRDAFFREGTESVTKGS